MVLSAEGCFADRLQATCHASAAAGVALVRGGFSPERGASLSQIETMSPSLPPPVLVKWTRAVHSLGAMLICLALGLDRLNGYPQRRRSSCLCATPD